ncbi:hypothetical protein [Novosphingobium sp. KACC 22771]|uniref:hypothetical protein n=1 Tax=Novosphingobium sp. KACC 22771 TaxID=3025670 RepID=UPI00236586B5|nr:hypothetical protein [Novosphingobium sp. KACC 22771]WDF74670.1 hypothetical protein PQ467_22295 [Novosphingobium sp. KACC 22771]
MMGQSVPAIALSAAYLVTAALAVLNSGRRGGGLWRRIALLLALLALWRLMGTQGWLMQSLRGWSQSNALYEDRRLVQVPMLYLALGLLYLAGRRGGLSLRRPRATTAWVAAMGLVALAILRAISLHGTDALLYQPVGPLHLHHIIDIALCATILACALLARLRAADPYRRKPS